MQKIPFYFLLLLVLGIAGLALQQRGKISDQALQISALEKTISARDQLVSETQKTTAKVEQQNKAFTEESAALRDKLAAQISPTPNFSAPPQAPLPEKKNAFSGMMEKMMGNPKMRDAVVAQQMAVIKPMYADLVKKLHLTPEETEKFYDLLASQTSKAMEAGMKMMSGDKNAIRGLKESTDGMKALLGDRYSAYEDYQKTIPDRAQLSQISSQLAARQTPLRPDQSAGLLQIMTQEKLNTAKFTSATTDLKNPNLSETAMNDTFQAQEDRNTRILARSKTLLTPDQWNALAEQQKQMLQMQRMGMEMAKGMFSQPSK